ncbi:hypothetical protein GQ53DRAFT_851493, partial [Thozetella sp. PMI_491]
RPLSPLVRDDLVNPTFDDLFQLALARVVNIIKQDHKNPPPLLFPTAEYTQSSFFGVDIWDEFGNMETEFSRLMFTLSRYKERGIPATCIATVQSLLNENSILDSWPQVVDILRDQAQEALTLALRRAKAQHHSEELKNTKKAFITFPINYATAKGTETQVCLWKRTLEEAAELLSSGNHERVEEFLQSHAFLKDPVGGLKGGFQRQTTHFMELLEGFRRAISTETLSHQSWQMIAAQLALESSFLAISKLRKVVYVHFSHHQVLPYIYVSLNGLPRSEFSVPKRVLEIINELVSGSTKNSMCLIAPITVAFVAPLKPGRKPLKVIIDGNNRTTALVLLKFLATQDLNNLDKGGRLKDYCQAEGLSTKWFVDIQDVMDELRRDNSSLEILRTRKDILMIFSSILRVPALVVQEQSFHTICQSRTSDTRPVLLQPMHQTFYNDQSLSMAWPAKGGQAHGRSLGYKPLPLR